jgi:hypothetical protein
MPTTSNLSSKAEPPKHRDIAAQTSPKRVITSTQALSS